MFKFGDFMYNFVLLTVVGLFFPFLSGFGFVKSTDTKNLDIWMRGTCSGCKFERDVEPIYVLI